MISVRKRKIMLKRIHTYFDSLGKFLTEQEYKADTNVPIRFALIKKYLGGYHRLRYYLSFYYPQWKEEEVVVVEPLVVKKKASFKPKPKVKKEEN